MKNSHFRHLRTLGRVALGLISAAVAPLRAAPTPTAAFTTVQSFAQVLDGVNPVSPLVLGADGNYYGVSTRGGRADVGVVFQTTPMGTTTIFFDFANDDTGGFHPMAGLCLAADGNFYGTTSRGGANSAGSFFELTTGGVLTTLYSFTAASDGSSPAGTLVQGADLALYGVCTSGGSNSAGTVYRMTTGGAFMVLHDFGGPVGANNDNDGRSPASGLCRGSDNNFYGVAPNGGAGAGVVFSITPTGTYALLHTFDGTDGTLPSGALVEVAGSPGVFMGVTLFGALGGAGNVYQISSTMSFADLHDFKPGIGEVGTPFGQLTRGSDGLYYGLGAQGGANDSGGIFATSPLGGASLRASFDPTGDTGAEVTAGLTSADSGNLFYGVTEFLGAHDQGMVFTLGVAGGAFNVLHNFFQGGNATSKAGLVRDSSGFLYGTTVAGGASNLGTVFELSPTGALTTLYDFAGPDASTPEGANPSGGPLALDSDGNLFGTTIAGGTNNLGTAYMLDQSDELTTLHSFGNIDSQGIIVDGSAPEAGLTLSNGNFFGVTNSGGENNDGVFFQLTPAGMFTSLQSLLPADGAGVADTLVLGSDGAFYGTAFDGGANGSGAVFRITSTGAETPVYSFSAPDNNGLNSDGAYPSASLLEGASRLFFGTAQGGGANGNGTIFTVTPEGAFNPLYSFSALVNGSNADGAAPQGLVKGSDGNFYGCTVVGGANSNGTVFVITPGGTLTVLHAFATVSGGVNAEGADPVAPLLEATPGTFYGTAQRGGTGHVGTIFSLTVSPAITSTAAAGFVGQAFSFQITATNGPTSFAADSLPTFLTLNTATGVISGTPPATGSFVFKIGAQNAGGFDDEFFVLNVAEPMAPTITSALTASAMVGKLFSYQITAMNLPTSYAADALPIGLTVDTTTGLISGTPTTAGTFAFMIGAQNAGGSDDETLTLTVSAAPKITSALTASAIAGKLFSYQITAMNLPTSYAADALPIGLTVDTTTGLISGTPTTAGTFAFMIGAQNASGSDDETLTLTVSAAVLAPKITSPLTASGQVGVAFTYQITATNFPTSYAADALPPGVTVNTMTGSISGTPTVSGIYAVEVGAQNATGADDEMLTLTIAAALERGPKITSALAVSGQAGVAFTYKITAGNSPTHFGADGLPAGLSVDAKTGVISGVTTLSGIFPVSLKATNAAHHTVSATLTLTVDPTVTLSVTVHRVKAGSGEAAVFQLTRVGDLSQPLTFAFELKGTAVNGTDYTIPRVKNTPMGTMGTRKFTAGHASRLIKVVPIDEKLRPGTIKVVKFVLEPGTGYVVAGDAAMIVKIGYGD